MANRFLAEAISQTHGKSGSGKLEITFVDQEGREQTIGLTPAVAGSLSKHLEGFASACEAGGGMATKMPTNFAVGVGRYEPVVLVRFEDDTPYGLPASKANQLGRALIEHAKIVLSQPVLHRQ
jgi:hypothetical protein